MARELGSKGVHVAYVLIDAAIDMERTRALRPDEPDDFFIQPADIAGEISHVVHQPRSAGPSTWRSDLSKRSDEGRWSGGQQFRPATNPRLQAARGCPWALRRLGPLRTSAASPNAPPSSFKREPYIARGGERG
jgi:hypothetical protein